MSEIKITPLGTVSPYPKGNHNCPGFLLEYNKEKLLLDCGSGTSRLLSMEEDLKNLSIIISHNHLDHYSDLTTIAYASYCYHNLGLINKRVKVYSRDINFEYLGNTLASGRMGAPSSCTQTHSHSRSTSEWKAV